MCILARVKLRLLAARCARGVRRAAGSPLGKRREIPKYKVTELHAILRNAFINKNSDVKTQTYNYLNKMQMHHICVNNS